MSDDVTTLDPILRPHEQISGYGLVKRRGRGGVAEVWEADSPAGYRVALKLVHLSTDLRSGELRALKITRSIRHPSLLEIFGTWQVENLLVICMELADLSLWDRFLEVSVQGLRGVPRSELLGYLGSVADAIDYLNDYKHSVAGRHGVGVQHRDLKPQNILLLGGQAKVADFGLARVMEQALASHTGPCTLPYAAPEYFGGKTSRQSDQYALAVTYCQLRGGWMPFPGSTAQITFGHLYNDPDLGGLPIPERPIVARALAKRPEERWPDCRSFIDALEALESDQGCPVPDRLPREQRDITSGQVDKDDPPIPSGLSLNSANSDFIPVDTGDLESAEFQAGQAGLGAFLSTGDSRLDHPSGFARATREARKDKRPVGNDFGRVIATWMAGLRPRFARVIGPIAAQMALGMATLIRGSRSRAARLSVGATALAANLRSKCVRVNNQVAAQTALGMATLIRGSRSRAARLGVGATASAANLRPKLASVIGPIAAQMALGMATLIRGTRSQAARLRVGATALAADLRPKLARVVNQVAARTALAMATLIRGIRSLTARLRDAATSSNPAVWMAGLRPKFARINQVAALATLGLATCAYGVWYLTARSRLGSPSSDTTAVRTAPRDPGLRVASSTGTSVASDEPEGTADTTVKPEETAHLSNLGGGSPHKNGLAKEGTSTTPDESTREAETTPEAPDVAAPEPVVRATMATRATVNPSESHAGSADSNETVPAPSVVSLQPQPTAPEALALTGPASMALAPEILTSSSPVTAVASLRHPELNPPTPTPLPSTSDQIKLEDKSQLAVPPGGTTAGDPVHSSPAEAVARSVSTPSLTLPAAISVMAGETTKLPVGVVRDAPSKPVHLDFRGLPRGITVGDPTIPAGTDQAEVVLSASAKTVPGTAEVVVAVTAGSKRDEAAIKMTILPSPARLACERGRAELNRGAYPQAVTAFTESIRLDPDSFGAHFDRGVAYYLEGRFREALADYTIAIRVEPGSADARLARARVHRDLGKYRLALEDYTEAIRLRPDAKGYVARGCLQHEIGAYDQALADFEIALGLRPDDLAARYRRGVTRYVMGDSAGAIPDFTEVIQHDPKHVGAYHYRRDAYARLGEYSRAGADHDTFVRLSHPSSKGVLK